MRKNGIEPKPKPKEEEVSLLKKFTSKITGFFKTPRENTYTPMDNNI